MPISCECPGCGKRLTAVDSAAGRKAHCPDCGSAVPIPRSKQPSWESSGNDGFDLQNLDVEAEMAGPIENHRVACPMCGEMIKAVAVRCRFCGENLDSRQQSQSSRGSGSGMPIPVILAMIVECLFIGLNVLGVAGNLMQSNIGGVAGSTVRVLIESAIILGLWQRKSAARTSALVLSGLGIFFMIACGGLLLVAGQQQQFMAQIPQELTAVVIAVLAAQTILYIVEIIALMTNSANEYLDQ